MSLLGWLRRDRGRHLAPGPDAASDPTPDGGFFGPLGPDSVTPEWPAAAATATHSPILAATLDDHTIPGRPAFSANLVSALRERLSVIGQPSQTSATGARPNRVDQLTEAAGQPDATPELVAEEAARLGDETRSVMDLFEGAQLARARHPITETIPAIPASASPASAGRVARLGVGGGVA